MARGRPPSGSKLVDQLDGSSQARRRLEAVLRTLSGEWTIPQACAALGISASRFHKLRNEVLQHAMESLEPRQRGRPPAARPDPRLLELEQQVQALRYDVQAAQIREELAMVFPGVVRQAQQARHRAGKKR